MLLFNEFVLGSKIVIEIIIIYNVRLIQNK